MNLAGLGKRKDILVAVGIILLTVIIGNNFIYRVQKRKMDYIRKEIKDEEVKNRLVKEVTLLGKKFDSYKKRLPSQRDASWLIRMITQLTKDAQIKVVSLKPKELDRQEGYVRVPLEVKVECSYHELGELLSNIESSTEFIRLDNLHLIKKRDKSPTVSLVISTVYLEE